MSVTNWSVISIAPGRALIIDQTAVGSSSVNLERGKSEFISSMEEIYT